MARKLTGMGGEPGSKRDVDDEYVPLLVAATVTYFQGGTLSEDITRTALSLSCISVLHVREGGTERMLSAEEAEERLAVPLQRGEEPPDLDAFLIRRGELRRALSALGEASAPWAKPPDR